MNGKNLDKMRPISNSHPPLPANPHTYNSAPNKNKYFYDNKA